MANTTITFASPQYLEVYQVSENQHIHKTCKCHLCSAVSQVCCYPSLLILVNCISIFLRSTILRVRLFFFPYTLSHTLNTLACPPKYNMHGVPQLLVISIAVILVLTLSFLNQIIVELPNCPLCYPFCGSIIHSPNSFEDDQSLQPTLQELPSAMRKHPNSFTRAPKFPQLAFRFRAFDLFSPLRYTFPKIYWAAHFYLFTFQCKFHFQRDDFFNNTDCIPNVFLHRTSYSLLSFVILHVFSFNFSLQNAKFIREEIFFSHLCCMLNVQDCAQWMDNVQ